MTSLLSRLAFRFARPILRLHFWLYSRNVDRAFFPEDEPEGVVGGPDPERILFVGDIAVAGYGVLRHGMSAASYTAAAIGQRTGRGVTWSTLTAFDLTAHRVATLPCHDTYDFSRVVFMIGIPDVLLATDAGAWGRDLRTVFARARESFGPDTQIVFAGIPPMHEFQPIPRLARLLIKERIDQLNATAMAVLEEDRSDAGSVFVVTPDWREGHAYVQESFSWKKLHHLWGTTIGSAAAGSSRSPVGGAPIAA
ncbi:hypothetical protein EDF46_2562 [Frondihabitans sp. PhB188]|uniref:GDSL-type esterase/lipase family protein n=1 Tax=Frondihabitans sp. PhB188 TaxID=2485200 RepID=UPI000F467BF0|nr:GDSL-type esterase/lipase family protein [Frondihabitans sp. PhB188]ROQ37113.1 hypothetical protein EDF46_2562 [Frondihabitans sp. PhB188]